MYWALSKGDLCWQDTLSLRQLPSKIHLALFSHLKLYMEKVSYALGVYNYVVLFHLQARYFWTSYYRTIKGKYVYHMIIDY